MSEHIILVAFEVDADNRIHAEQVVRTAMPIPGRQHVFGSLESWWVAEDDRHDGSDNDSAVFVRPGNQNRARAVLFAEHLTDVHNVVMGEASRFEEDTT